MPYTYTFPTLIRFGAGVIQELVPHLKEKKFETPFVVTDSAIRSLPFFQTITSKLPNATLFSDLHTNPLKSDVERGAVLFNQNKCDCVIGIGGGVSLDVARAIALKAFHSGDLFEYEKSSQGEEKITDKIPYFVCIPTTSGTGSEVGRSAIIADDHTKEKKILFSPHLLAKVVFADPELTLSLPPEITAATGMDALTHHIEAYVAKGYHPMCDGIALEGIRLIKENIIKATHQPDLESRGHMMIASLMGAVSFQKGLGVIHSTAHPLSTMYNIHHGLANAVMLPYGVEFNLESCPNKFSIIKELFNTEFLPQTLQELNRAIGLPTKLDSIGVKKEDISELAHLAYLDFCHPSNPREVQEKDFKTLYKRALC